MAPRRDRLPARRQGAAAPGRRSPRARRACCPAQTRRRCCGRSTSTRDGATTAVRRRAGHRAQPGQARLRRRAGRRRRRHARPTPIALLPEIGRLLHRARARPRRHQPADPGAGGRAATAAGGGWCCARPDAGRGVERADLAADRHGRGRPSCSRAGSACCARCPRRGPRRSRMLRTAAAGAGHRLAGRAPASAGARRVDPANPRGAALRRPGRGADARRGLHRVRRCSRRPSPGTARSAAPYAHVTAPLRRLADRYATEVCLCLSDGVRGAGLGARRAARSCPTVMAAVRPPGVGGRAGRGRPGRGGALADRVGEEFDAVVLDADGRGHSHGNHGSVAQRHRRDRRAAGAGPLPRRAAAGRADPGAAGQGRPGKRAVRSRSETGLRAISVIGASSAVQVRGEVACRSAGSRAGARWRACPGCG